MWQSDDAYNNNFSGKAGQDACRQDSGGPLITKLRGQRYAQIGIVHVGSDCQVKHEKKLAGKSFLFCFEITVDPGQASIQGSLVFSDGSEEISEANN